MGSEVRTVCLLLRERERESSGSFFLMIVVVRRFRHLGILD